jgi:Mce-associated membrane protein
MAPKTSQRGERGGQAAPPQPPQDGPPSPDAGASSDAEASPGAGAVTRAAGADETPGAAAAGGAKPLSKAKAWAKAEVAASFPDPPGLTEPTKPAETVEPGETSEPGEAGAAGDADAAAGAAEDIDRPAGAAEGMDVAAGAAEDIDRPAGAAEGMDVAAGAAGDADGAAAGAGPRRALRAPVLLALATVVLGGFGIFATVRAHDLRSNGTQNLALTGPATSDVKRQVDAAVTTIFSYRYNDTGATRRAAQSLLTGPAIRQYNRLFSLVQQQAPAEKLIVTTKVTNSAVEFLTGDRARVLVFANQQDSRAGTSQASYAGTMFAVTAVHSGGHWKIENIDTFTG